MEEWLGSWASAVGEHHERWDGDGYPNGISGERISLAGRIVAVADVFDVITSARSYKSSFASSAARDEIARCAGTQFDPRVVRAFLNISLGRLRLVMGPLSWLAHVPVLARLPLTPAIGAAAASAGAVVVGLATGLVAPPVSIAQVGPGSPASDRAGQRRSTGSTPEDSPITIGVAAANRGLNVTALRDRRSTAGRSRSDHRGQ